MIKMKKRFSMLIALAMILTSLVPSFTASAAFSDVDDSNSYVEAISTLSTLQVINGYEDGSFQPEKEITRAEYTKMIVYMLGMDSFTTPITTFTDVPESHWANAYIKTAFDMGIINGFDDGTFRPDAPVTYEQALKMLVCTLGYEAYAEVAGGYPNGYRAQAEDLDLTDIVTGVGYESNAPRAVIAQIMFNGLEVPMKGMVNGKLEDTGKTLINDYLGAVNLKGTLVGVANSTTSDCPVSLYPTQMAVKNSQTQDIVVIDFSQSEVTQAELVAKLGRSISVLYRKDRVSTDKWLVGLNNDTQKGAEITVNSTDIISFDGSTLKYRDNEGANATLRVDSSNVTVQYNGRAANGSNLSNYLSPSSDNFMYGTARFVSNDSSSTYNMVDIYDYEVMVALRAVNSSDYTITDKIPTFNKETETDEIKKLTLKPNVNEFSLTKNGSEIEPTSISANDVVIYAPTLDGSFTTVKVSNKSVSGSVESLNSSKQTIKINGKDYNYTGYFKKYMEDKENGLPTPGQSIKAYLDDFGTIQWGTVTSSEKYYQYAYIVEPITADNGNDYYLKLFAPSSRTATSLTSSTSYKVQSFKLAENVKLNGEKKSPDALITALAATAEAGSGTDLNQFIRISTNASNEIDNVITVTDTGKENTDSSKLVKYATRGSYKVTSTALKLSDGTTKHSLKSSTPLFVIPDNRADVDNYALKATISNSSLKDDGTSYSLESYDLNTSKYPAFLAYYPEAGKELTSDTPISTDTNFSVLTEDIGEEVIDGEVANVISTYTTDTKISKKRLADHFSSSAEKGDLVLFGYDSDGYVNAENICIDYSNDIQPILTAATDFDWTGISGTPATSGSKKITYTMYNVLQTVESENKLYVSSKLYESEGVFNTNYEVLNITSSTKIVRYDKDEDEFTPYAVGTDTLLTINDILDAEGFGTGCSKIAVGAYLNTYTSSNPIIKFIVIYD